MRIFSLIFIALLFINSATAQEKKKDPNDWKFSGFAHIIGQMDGKDFDNSTHPLYNTTMKFRFGVEKSIFDDLTFKVELQDSRIMGTSFVSNTHNTDLLEGYVEYKNVFNKPLSIQAGRFQMQYNDERYIGRSLWHMSERAFDGVRVKYHTEKFDIDYFHTQHTSSTPYLLKVMPSNYPYPETDYSGYGMYGFWSTIKPVKNQSFDVFAFLEHNGVKSNGEDADLNRYTAGACYDGKFGAFSAKADFAYQFGNMKSQDIGAYNFVANLGYKVNKKVNVNVGTNMISGSDPDSEDYGVFINYPASKHKFLGLMDYFLITKQHQQGVNDFFVKASLGGMKIGQPFSKSKSNLKAMLQFHHFMTNTEPSSGETAYGQELDLVLKYDVTKGAFIQFGGGIFMPGDLMKTKWETTDDLGNTRMREDISFWAFTMLFVKLN